MIFVISLPRLTNTLPKRFLRRSEYLREKSEWDIGIQSIPIRGWIHRKMMIYPNPVEKPIKSYEANTANVLDNLPNGDFIAATLVRGIEAVKSEQSAKAPKKVVKKRKAPPPTDGGDASPPIENSTTRKQKEKAKILDRKGPLSANDLAAFLAD